MRKLILTFALALLSLPAAAQAGRLDLRFDHLEAKAEETVDINLEGPMLRLAAKFLSAEDPDEKAVRDVVSGLTAGGVKG